MMDGIVENKLIQQLTRNFHRSPVQINDLQTSDAEIIRFPADESVLLALTTDSVVEEIAVGLYHDPYLAGWMVVMANMSDLAAVGAQPTGILVSEVLPFHYPGENLDRLQQGIRDACLACGTAILGGDTNTGDALVLTGCAVGSVRSTKLLTRIGARPGDSVFSTNLLGLGNAFAISHFLGRNGCTQVIYKPYARLTEGRTLGGCARACMDTSDGLLATLDQLVRLNEVGIELDRELSTYLHPDAMRIALETGVAPWLLLAGQHGEFELVFTVDKNQENQLLLAASAAGWQPVRIGRVTEEPVVRMTLDHGATLLDTGRIRNLASETHGSIGSYINALCAIDNELRKGE